jgi:hypothetical protein
MVSVNDLQLLVDSYVDVKKNINITSQQVTDLYSHVARYKHTESLSWHLDTIKSNLDEIEALSIDIYVSELVTTIIHHFSNIEFLVLNLINTEDAGKLQYIVKTIRLNTNIFIEDMADLHYEEPQLVDISDQTSSFLDSFVNEQGIIAAYFQNRQLVAKLSTDLLLLSKKVTISEDALSQIKRFGEQNVTEANEQLDLTIVYSTTSTIGVGALIHTIVISFFLARMIKKPFKTIMEKLNHVVQGDSILSVLMSNEGKR